MMRARYDGHYQDPALPTLESSGKECWVWCVCRGSALIVLFFLLMALGKPAGAQNGIFTISAAPGGIAFAVGGGGSTLSGQFGVMNALGLGTPATGVTVIPLANGALYITHFQITISNLPNPHRGG